jgi:anti-sigma regulatory factor (Ser/Thr protein kinase)
LLLEQEFAPGNLYALRAAVHELAANTVKHGAGQGRLVMWRQDGALHCRVDDDGPPGKGREGAGGNAAAGWLHAAGHDLSLVRLLADRLTVVSGARGTRAAVTFVLPAGPAPGMEPGEA